MHRSEQVLLLAVRLWAVMPEDLRASCQLLPREPPAPPRGFFQGRNEESNEKAAGGAAAAAAAFFTAAHLELLLPMLRATSAAQPRLHSLWPTLLALLLPGFSAARVRWCSTCHPSRSSPPCKRVHAVLIMPLACSFEHVLIMYGIS